MVNKNVCHQLEVAVGTFEDVVVFFSTFFLLWLHGPLNILEVKLPLFNKGLNHEVEKVLGDQRYIEHQLRHELHKSGDSIAEVILFELKVLGL